jgi:hypothetical protein
MDVRRPKWMTALSIEQLSDDVTVSGNRVSSGLDAPEGETAGVVGDELASQIHVRLIGILALVESRGGRMPHIHFGAGDRLTSSGLFMKSSFDDTIPRSA